MTGVRHFAIALRPSLLLGFRLFGCWITIVWREPYFSERYGYTWSRAIGKLRLNVRRSGAGKP